MNHGVLSLEKCYTASHPPLRLITRNLEGLSSALPVQTSTFLFKGLVQHSRLIVLPPMSSSFDSGALKVQGASHQPNFERRGENPRPYAL